jgi:chromosomal replication initiation ATPase DnaA
MNHISKLNTEKRPLVPAVGETPRAARQYVIPACRNRAPLIAEIIAEVAKETGLTVALLVGDRRSRPIAAARHYAFWRAARETGASLAAIGRMFGERDHTTILHGIRRHEERIAK